MVLEHLMEKGKDNPRLYCLYLFLKSMNDKEICKKIIGIKRNPYSIVINRYGNMEPDKWIYEINFNENYQINGFCSLYKFVLAHLAYAEDLGLTPVVYWGDKTLYYDQTIRDSNNCFEYYFKPVSEMLQNQVRNCKNVIISKPVDRFPFCTSGGYTGVTEDEVIFLSDYARRYIQIKDEVRRSFWDKLEEFTDGNNTLGIHVRATDFNEGFNRHPVVVSPEEYLQAAKEIFENENFDKVFLATDDNAIISMFKSQFGDKLYFYDDTFRSVTGKAIHYGNDKVKRERHKYLLGLEILRDFYTLGYCAGLVAGISNVSTCARIVAASREQGYRKLCILDKGINHNHKETRLAFKHHL